LIKASRPAHCVQSRPARAEPYYLDSNSNPTDVLHSGFLSSRAPSNDKPDHYVYDPRNIGTAELAMTLDSSNLTRQRLVYAAAGKVLVYHSEPFEKDTEVSGIFKLSVWLAIDQPDTEFEAAVYEIGSNGSSIIHWWDGQRADREFQDAQSRADASSTIRNSSSCKT